MVIDISKQNSNSGGGGKSSNFLFPAKIKRIILDGSEYTNSPSSAHKWGGYDAVGRVFYNIVKTRTQTTDKNVDFYDKEEVDTWDGTAIPLFSFQKYYPLINEVVMIMTITSKDYLADRTAVQNYYMPSLNLWNSQHHNTLPSVQNYADDKSEIHTNKDYELAGLLRRVEDGELNVNIPLGKYFKEQLNIKPLLPYEGDHIIEGRFGNSIRLGATARSKVIPKEQKNNWSSGTKGDPHGDPITILRNGQAEGLDKKGWMHTLEDINLDPSSIYLTSNQKIDNLIITSTHWNTFGLNASIPQDEQQEAKKFLDSPVDYMMSEEVEIEEEEEIIEKVPEKAPEETIKECPVGQEWDDVVKKCVLSTIEVTGSLETETTGSEVITEEEAGLVEEDTSRYYDTPTDPEKETIDGNLPEDYIISDLEDVPYYYTTFTSDTYYYNTPTEADGKARCENCAFFKAGSSANENSCSQWDAKVRRNWYCNSYTNGLEDSLKNIRKLGKKTFTVTSPDPHVGKKGYIEHNIDIGKKYFKINSTIIQGESRSTPSFQLSNDPIEVVKNIRKGIIPPLLGLSEGELFIKFDDNDFENEIGPLGPPPPPPGPFDYLIGRYFEGTGKHEEFNVSKDLAKQDALAKIYSEAGSTDINIVFGESFQPKSPLRAQDGELYVYMAYEIKSIT